jgi:hypothetical protein
MPRIGHNSDRFRCPSNPHSGGMFFRWQLFLSLEIGPESTSHIIGHVCPWPRGSIRFYSASLVSRNTSTDYIVPTFKVYFESILNHLFFFSSRTNKPLRPSVSDARDLFSNPVPCIHEQDSDANQQFQRVYIDGKDTNNVSLLHILKCE